MATGQPVWRSTLAQRVGNEVETIDQILSRWPGVFSDAQQRVVGYWGLAISDFLASSHDGTVDGQRLSAWCAWDTLFLPQLLGKPATIESTSPTADITVRLTVTPERLQHVDPTSAHMSCLLPDAAEFQTDLVRAFCHFVHFFPSRESGERWAAQHPGTFLLSIAEAHVLAHRKNEMQYPAML